MNILTNEMRTAIVSEYCHSTVTDLSKKYHVSTDRIKQVLKENNIVIRTPTKSTTEKDWDYKSELIKRYPKHNGKHYVAKSIDGKMETDDYLNSSGVLTTYIKKNIGINVPSLYKRIKYFHEYGKQWYEQYFNIVEVPDENIPVKKCPYCSWSTIDVDNKSGMFETHLSREHGITKIQYLEEHPEDREYFTLVCKTKDIKMETDKRKFVTCCICGEKFARLDWRHLAKHGVTKYQYIAKYGNGIVSEKLHDKLSEIAIENNKNMKPVFVSKPEIEISEFIKSFGVECENGNRSVLNGKELDIYIPSLKFAIEYNGNFWHNDKIIDKNKHLNKTELCKKKGIKLLQIFEDEYFNNKEIVFKKIRHIISYDNTLTKIPGRKCTVNEINKDTAKTFLNVYHIQGFAGSKVYLGAYYENMLVAVMTFKQENTGNWELTRFASDYNYICQGVGGKLFKYFIRNYNPAEVKSFADRRWTVDEDNNIYIKLGFRFDKYTKPDYRYYNPKIDRYKRFHKFNFRKTILNKKYHLPLTMTESEMTTKIGCSKIYDCGLIKYVWKKE